MDITGSTAIVTGGASGIGAAVAGHLADLGAHVTVLDRDETAAKEVASALGGDAVGLDLTDAAAIDAADLEADILVNNAGVQHVAPVQDFPPDRFAMILRLMLEAPFLLSRAALPHMYAQGWGRIIHISSAHGLRASAFKSAYVSAKHGLEGLSKVLALEGAEHGVTSNCVNPGYVRTPLVEKQIPEQAKALGISEAEVIRNVMLKETVDGEFTTVQDVAEAALFLAAFKTNALTGQSLIVSHGWFME